MTYRKSALALAITACLAIGMPAHAQDAQQGEQTQKQSKSDKAAQLETVTVVGIRASLMQALETKRNADSIVDVVTAEDIGQFASTNVAEAITIIPGVTIDHAFGQGEKVSILGTDPALNRTLLNGHAVASADWMMAEQPGRSFNYTLLAPELVSKVVVHKSPEARLAEGSIGGTVDIVTRKPLDLSGITVSGSLRYLYNDRIGEGDPSYSALFGWKNTASTFGLIISAQHSEEAIRREGIEAYGTVTGADYINGKGDAGSINNLPIDWSKPANPDGSWQTYPASCVGSCATTLLANPGAVGPNSLSAHYFNQDRTRDTISLALQFKPNEHMNVEFNALHVKADYDNVANSMFSYQGNTFNGLEKMTGLSVDGGVITSGTFKNSLVVYDMISRRSSIETDSYNLKADWNANDWFVSAEIGYSNADGGVDKQVYGEFLNWSDYTYDISGTPTLTFQGNNPFLDPSAFRMDGGWGSDPSQQATWNTGWGGNIAYKPTSDEEKYAQLDFGIRLNSPIYLIRFGANLRRHTVDQTMGGVSLATVTGYGDRTAAEFNPHPTPDGYLDGFGNVGDLKDRFVIDGWKLADYIMSGDWLAPWQSMPEASSFTAAEFASNTWTVSEDIDAVYVQADFAANRLRGNFGVRVVRTRSESLGWQCLVSSNCTTTANNGQSLYQQVSHDKSYTNVLPSINLIYDANDDLVLRGAMAKVMARPNYNDMSNYLWLSPQSLNGGGGNPDLDPYESTNLNFSAEWYFSEGAILAGTMFYKDIQNYILYKSRSEKHLNESNNTMMDFQVSRPLNAGTATITGMSLAFQKSFVNGFGLLTNYTWVAGEADNGDPLPYSSEHQFNLSPFFEKGRWSARVTYSWRSKYYTRVDRGNYLVTDDYASLSASLKFRINDNVGIGLDGMNLLDSNYYTYAEVPGVANTEKLIRGSYRSGRRLMATLNLKF